MGAIILDSDVLPLRVKDFAVGPIEQINPWIQAAIIAAVIVGLFVAFRRWR